MDESVFEVPLAGWFVAKRFDVVRRDWLADIGARTAVRHYGWPVEGAVAPYRYRGIDRDWITGWRHRDASLAEVRVAEIQRRAWGDVHDAFGVSSGVLPSADDAADVLTWCHAETPGEFESGWARVIDCDATVPAGLEALGFEPSWFPLSDFSALADCLLLPRWHGADEAGTEFVSEFESLNVHGLFRTAAGATAFIERYLSFAWSEPGEYHIVEVFGARVP
jgi:hypothetical protein